MKKTPIPSQETPVETSPVIDETPVETSPVMVTPQMACSELSKQTATD